MHEIKKQTWKRRAKGTNRPLRRNTLQKSGRKTTKNLWWSLSQVGERGKVEIFWKRTFWKRHSDLLKKTCFMSFDRSKNSFDRLKQTETLLKNFEKSSIDWNRQRLSRTYLKIFDRSKWTEALSNIFKNFRLIEKQNGSIEMGRGLLNLRKNTVFWKTFRINSKHWNLRTKCMSMWWCDFKNKSFKPKFPKTKFLAFSTNFQATT